MVYKNLLAYTQQWIDRILRPHQRYVRAYVDDIVIFSKLLKEYLWHLQNVFQELNGTDNLVAKKVISCILISTPLWTKS